jgi:hypothetical protein
VVHQLPKSVAGPYGNLQIIYAVDREGVLSRHDWAKNAETRDRTEDLQIFSLTLSQLSYFGDNVKLRRS